MGELAVTVIGRDRPGIIADAAQALAGLGLNLTDSTMTLLRGHFAMMLVCVGDRTTSEVEAALTPLTADGTLLASVREIDTEAEHKPEGERHVLTVHGADRLGIVAAVTRVIADVGGNVTDSTTRLSGPLYLLIAEVDLPLGVDVDLLAERLESVGRELGIDIGRRPAEADLL